MVPNSSVHKDARLQICIGLEALGVVSASFVLVLSVVRRGVNFNIGPRIFVINLMLMDIINSLASMFSDVWISFVTFVTWMIEIFGPKVQRINRYSVGAQNVALLSFNCSFVPMMIMSIVACHSSSAPSDATTIRLFLITVVAADAFPVVLQVSSSIITGMPSVAFLPYIAATYVLYATQVVLTFVALRTVIRRSNQYPDAGASSSASATARKALTRVLLFSIGPCVVQLPFAISVLTKYLVAEVESDLVAAINGILFWPVKYTFASKALIDTASTLLFLGEYRQYLSVAYGKLRFMTAKVFPSLIVSSPNVTHVDSSSVISVRPLKSLS
ncbi:hypothetical protein AAVH_16383 [Aphelenchoides avenae]|nr:hypothetical protein AAVH_16383 [Aphelenchus avenae]